MQTNAAVVQFPARAQQEEVKVETTYALGKLRRISVTDACDPTSGTNHEVRPDTWLDRAPPAELAAVLDLIGRHGKAAFILALADYYAGCVESIEDALRNHIGTFATKRDFGRHLMKEIGKEWHRYLDPEEVGHDRLQDDHAYVTVNGQLEVFEV